MRDWPFSKQMEGKGENPPFIQDIHDVKSKCIPKLSKGIKRYKSPVKTITSLDGSSTSNVKAPAVLCQLPEFQSYGEQTLHLPNTLLDIKTATSNLTELEMFDFRMAIDKESAGVYERNANKRVNGIRKDSSDEAKPDEIKKQGGRTDITFEFTDSEEDESNISGNKDTGSSLYYSCKHCVYSDVNVDNVSAHYQNDHPYIVYNQAYIQDPSDLSATFRCLTCPVEFLTLSDLKAHNTENHPLSTNLFTIRSSQLSFKCFVCAFTCGALEEVKTHYKDKHPTYDTDSTLTFCRYWVDTREEEQPQLNDCVAAPVSETPQQCSPNTSPTSRHENKDVNVDNVSARYKNDHTHVTYKQVNVEDPSDLSVTFRCLTCPVEFLTSSDLDGHNAQSHHHPPTQPTIQSSDFLIKCCVCACTCSSLEEVKSHYNEEHPKHALDCTLTICKNWEDICEEEQTQLNDCVQAPVSEMPTQCSPNPSPTSRPDSRQTLPSNQNQNPASQNTTPANCLMTEQKSSDKTKNQKYQCPETLFYCQKCNYANATVQGVLNHQIGIHRVACREDVFEHTKKICDELKRLQFQAKDSSFTCRLPLPILEKGDENMLFCHLCNYKNKKMGVVLRHYLVKHNKWKIECDQVKKHSSNIHRQIKDLHPQETSGQKIIQVSLEGEKITKGSADSQQKKEETKERNDPDDTDSRPPSPRSEQEETRPITCKVCLFSCTSTSVILQHYHTAHPWSVKKDGSLRYPITRRRSRTQKRLEVENEIPQSFESYQVPLEFENPPTVAVSPKKIQCTFCPETFPTQRCVDAHSDKMHRDGVMDDSDAQMGEPSTTSSAHPDNNDSPLHLFRCPYCSFVSGTLVGIFIHCSVIHPGLVITKENCDVQTVNRLDFEKFGKRKGSSLTLSGYMCKNCPQIYVSHQMLSTHRQEVHYETTAELQPEPQALTWDKEKPCNSRPKSQSTTATEGSVCQQGNSEVDDSPIAPNTALVYQCPECPYVNFTDYGFLMHLHQKHPSLLVRAKDFQKEKTIIANFDQLKNDKRFINSGYKCKKCLCIFLGPSKLNAHLTRNECSYKDNTSALDRTEDNPNLSRQWLEVENEIPPSFESYQVPLEFENSPTVSPKKIQCTFCPETFPTQRCVDAHCDKMHCDGVMDDSDAQMGEPSTTSSAHPDNNDSPLHLFRCPCCSYVSSTPVGVFIHSSVIHPDFVITKENCDVQTVNRLDFEKCGKRKSSSLTLSGYMCKNCPQVYVSQQMLSTHRQEVHCETTAEPQTLTWDKEKPCNSRPKSQSTTATEGSVCQQGNSEVDDSPIAPNTVLVYQCPECPYVNGTDYGFLMHFQQKHPSLLVRAKEFQKEKTIIANFDKLKNDKRFISGGYKCKKCLRIFYKASKLNVHLKKRHCSYKDNTSTLANTEDNPNLSSLAQKDDSLYRCRLCPYKGLFRRYLSDHYRHRHKLNLTARRKLIESDYRSKRSKAAASKKSFEASHLESKTRPHSEIQSTKQFVSHGRTVPLSVHALNFVVLAKPSKKSTGLYKCCHCSEHMSGTKRLSSHLDEHRDSAKQVAVDPDPGDHVPAPAPRDEPPVLETIQDLAPEGTFGVPQSPPPPPSMSQTLERMEPVANQASFACKHCSRVFKHQKGLASHERSHATVVALRKKTLDSTSTLKHNINKYILSGAENRRPFTCTLCRYSTNIVSLLRRHLLKKHESIVRCLDVTGSPGSEQSTVSKVASPTKTVNDLPEDPEGLQVPEGLSYSEAPEVQRQLDHYNKVAQASDASEANVQKEAPPAASLLQCELCSYSARCLPTLRKHYSTRHGRRTLTCKDCSFVTSSKKSMKKHTDLGHDSSRQLPANALLNNLSCPFCLYQTQNKNYMIDHIILHREERVVPIEPCRPHLSRYLQGIVLRCHKCTFTSGSAESLRLHMTKHDDVKPYKCQLCYFDCTQLGDLEAHLSDKHQVLRNHELVGQIRLDELEARLDRTTPEESHTAPDMSAIKDCDDVFTVTQTKTVAEIRVDVKHLQDKDASQSPTLEQEDPQQAQCFVDTGAEKETEVAAGQAENVSSLTEKKDVQIQENQTQLKPGNGDVDNVRKSGLKEKIVQLNEGSSHKRPRTERMSSDSKIEEKILRCVLQLEKDDGAVTKRRKSELDRPAKEEMKMETMRAHNHLLFTNTSIINPTKLDGVRSPTKFKFRRHSLTYGLHNARRRFSSGGAVPVAACKDEQIGNPGGSEEVEVAEEGHLLTCCKENDQGVDEATHQRKRPRREDDGAMKRVDNPHTSEGAHTTPFACNLCGRKLVNSYQLERHIVQHGK